MTFANIVAGSYTLVSAPPAGANWQIARACNSTGTSGSTAILSGGQTLTFDVGYTLGSAWVQSQGGDVYAAGSLGSYIPTGITPRAFSTDGTGGYPGVVTYGTSYDFDGSASGGTGETLVSSENWLANATRTSVDYYDYFYRRYGSPTTPSTFANLLAVTKPASSATPYYVVGDMTTSGNSGKDGISKNVR